MAPSSLADIAKEIATDADKFTISFPQDLKVNSRSDLNSSFGSFPQDLKVTNHDNLIRLLFLFAASIPGAHMMLYGMMPARQVHHHFPTRPQGKQTIHQIRIFAASKVAHVILYGMMPTRPVIVLYEVHILNAWYS